MDQMADFEVWRQIPPEEKIQIMSRAHANGVMTALIAIMIFSTLAVGLQVPALIWVSIIMSPLLFQFAAGKAWRSLRPRIMLEYLAARSAARRYAFAANGADLGISLIFRGRMQTLYDSGNLETAMESMVAASNEAEVWIALFNDALVMMEEKKGGASCEFACVINDKLTVHAKNGDEENDYTNDKELIINLAPEKSRPAKKVRLTSPYPGALVVFEKKLVKALEEAKLTKAKEHSAPPMDMQDDLDY